MSRGAYMSTSPDDEQQRKALDDALAAKKKEEQDIADQKKQIETVGKVVGTYSMFSGLWGVASGVAGLINHSVGILASLIPPLNTVIRGFTSILEAVEALFLSDETLNRRAVRAANALTGNVLSIAALALAANPATAPLGGVLSLTAMTLSTAKEAFFWYKTNKDLRKADKELLKAREQLNSEIDNALRQESIKVLIEKYKSINTHLNWLIQNTPDDPSSISQTTHEKQQVVKNIEDIVNQNKSVVSYRANVDTFNKISYEKREIRNQKRSAFFYSLLSTVGMVCVVLAAFATIGALAANPVTLGIVGVSLFGLTTAGMIKNRLFPGKKEEPKAVSLSAQAPQKQTESNKEEVAQLNAHPEMSMTMKRLHRLLSAPQKRLARSSSAPVAAEPPAAVSANTATEEPKISEFPQDNPSDAGPTKKVRTR